ncbi:MAG: zinc-dependent alcohol dehydrogenase family protein [Deltaproteobacteria bacterium]|nr:zinc-dependent alcohol dehydrogenase family protein [Deltaproteobacteria bacterium]
MNAMTLSHICNLDIRSWHDPLAQVEIPDPEPGEDELLVAVSVCGVCHTELDEIEGRTTPPHLPIVPGHQVVGRIISLGKKTSRFSQGDRVGIGWIYKTCGCCNFCRSGLENLCAAFTATGRDVNGGYGEFIAVPEAFAHVIPDIFSDSEASLLLCAGAVGYRSLRLANIVDGQPLGLTGFGSSGHLVLMTARHIYPSSNIYVFARNESERRFAMDLGAHWAGDTADSPPQLLQAIIDTTPAWRPVIASLEHLSPGGRLVINAIRKETSDRNILSVLDYSRHLWMEKEIKTVANVTRRDINDFLALAASIPIKPELDEFPLAEANRALRELKGKQIRGGKVLRIT